MDWKMPARVKRLQLKSRTALLISRDRAGTDRQDGYHSALGIGTMMRVCKLLGASVARLVA